MKRFCLALSNEEKQQIISSAIIPVFLLGILTSYTRVSINCIVRNFVAIFRSNNINVMSWFVFRRMIKKMWSLLWKIRWLRLLQSKMICILCIWFLGSWGKITRFPNGLGCGVVWCVVWCIIWYNIVYGMVWYGMVWYGTVWYGMVWYGMVLCGVVWYGIIWYGIVWYGHSIANEQ